MQRRQRSQRPRTQPEKTYGIPLWLNMLSALGPEISTLGPQAKCAQPVSLNNPQNTDVFETDVAYTVVSDVGNYQKNDITVTFDGPDLVVNGDRNLNFQRSSGKLYSNRTTKFTYKFRLENVDNNNTTAKLENGTLTVTVPKVKKVVTVVQVTDSQPVSDTNSQSDE